MKHTPGPWTSKKRRTNVGIFGNRPNASWIPVADVSLVHSDGEANARLIAAAPLMKVELENIRDTLKVNGPLGIERAIAICEATIAKAEE